MTRNDVITATYRVNTPLFLGGADPKTSAELRLPSFKGALRFWWRALKWENNLDINDLRKQEAELFGSSDQKIGQSKVRMQLSPMAELGTSRPPEVLQSVTQFPGARYLGYGVMEAFASSNKGTKAGQLIRPCIPAPFEFTVKLRLRRTTEKQTYEILNALIALGLFGGLGSKSRKGYGSLTLLKMERDGESFYSAPTTTNAYKEAVEKLKLNRTAEEPLPFTAFGSHRILILPANKDDKTLPKNKNNKTLDLLDRIGRELVHYRSWGHKGKVFKQPREPRFKFDHDLMKAVEKKPRHLSAEFHNKHPQRIAFGLPHNYGKNADRHHVKPAAKDLERRSSPLFIHIHETPQSSPFGVVLFMPSIFLPDEKNEIKVGKFVVPLNSDVVEFYQPVNNFLDRLLNGSDKDKFDGAMEL